MRTGRIRSNPARRLALPRPRRRDHVFLSRRRIDLRRAFSDVGGTLVLGTPKSHNSRTVPLPRFLAAELADYTRARKPDDLVFTTASGEDETPESGS